MAVGSQYKVNQLAKDLSLKTKELTDVMAAAGLDAKTQKALETFELDVIWETLTKSHQIVGIEDYIDGVTGIPSLRKKAAETKPEVKAEKSAEKNNTGSKYKTHHNLGCSHAACHRSLYEVCSKCLKTSKRAICLRIKSLISKNFECECNDEHYNTPLQKVT